MRWYNNLLLRIVSNISISKLTQSRLLEFSVVMSMLFFFMTVLLRVTCTLVGCFDNLLHVFYIRPTWATKYLTGVASLKSVTSFDDLPWLSCGSYIVYPNVKLTSLTPIAEFTHYVCVFGCFKCQRKGWLTKSERRAMYRKDEVDFHDFSSNCHRVAVLHTL